MKRPALYCVAAICGLALVIPALSSQETAHAQGAPKAPDFPLIFQAAGPTIASIQSMVDAFRAALGGQNNGNAPGPIAAGRREINWDGGGSTATSIVPTPFDGFLNNRGARFTTPGTGFVQAPASGLATTFNNATYENIFQAFSPVRLFSAIDSNVTLTQFFLPGGGEIPATTNGFGAVFTDVDQVDRRGSRFGAQVWRPVGTTAMAFYDVEGKLLFASEVPASPGTGSLSFLGVVFTDARVAFVRIRSGAVAPGPNDTAKHDVVMMDDFIYGEPQLIQ